MGSLTFFALTATVGATAKRNLLSQDLAYANLYTQVLSWGTNWTFASNRCKWRNRHDFGPWLSGPGSHKIHQPLRRWNSISHKPPDHYHQREAIDHHQASRMSSIWHPLGSINFIIVYPRSSLCEKSCLLPRIPNPTNILIEIDHKEIRLFWQR